MEAKKERREIILYSILLVVSFVFYKWIIPTQIYMNALARMERFDPDTFPNFATIFFMIAALMGLVGAIIRYVKAVKLEGKPVKEKVEKTQREKVGAWMPYIVFALVLVYIILFSKIGFIPATAIIPPIILFVIGCRKPHFYLYYYVFVTLMYLLFRFVLSVPIH